MGATKDVAKVLQDIVTDDSNNMSSKAMVDLFFKKQPESEKNEKQQTQNERFRPKFRSGVKMCLLISVRNFQITWLELVELGDGRLAERGREQHTSTALVERGSGNTSN